MNVAFWKILGQHHLKMHYELTVSIENAPDTADVIEIDFVKGVPVSIDG